MYEQGAFAIINEHQHQFSELVSQIIKGLNRNEIDGKRSVKAVLSA